MNRRRPGLAASSLVLALSLADGQSAALPGQRNPSGPPDRYAPSVPSGPPRQTVAPGRPGPPDQPGPSGLDERRNAAVTLVSGEIERFTGPVDRHCGIYTLAGDPQGPPAATRRQIATALRCVQAAKRQGRASWAVWQVAGVDWTTFAGLAVTAVSDVHLVDTGGSPTDVSLRPCLRPRVDGEGLVVCRNQPVDEGSGPRALDRFRADVARSFGKDVASEIARAMARVTPGQASPTSEAQMQRLLTAGRTALAASQGVDWPLCPIHRTHGLVLRDQHWRCEQDGVFVAPLGRLRRLRPARPLP